MGKREHSFIVLQTGAATGEVSVDNAHKAKSKFIYDPAIAVLGQCTPHTLAHILLLCS